MSNSSSSSSSAGIGFVGVLQVAFIILKLLGKISWKWVWVLAPSWIMALIIIGVIIILIILASK